MKEISHATNHLQDRDGDDQNPAEWRAQETALGQLLCCAEDVERRCTGTDEAQRCKIESESLVQWASQSGRLLDLPTLKRLTPSSEELEGGAEHQVWSYNNGTHHLVYKTTRPPNFGARGRLHTYVLNALWNNYLFEDDIRLEGVCLLNQGVALVITQPFIQGRSPTLEEIANWFGIQGYVEHKGVWTHSDTGTRIADAHEGNFIMMESGVLVPIDLQVLTLGRIC